MSRLASILLYLFCLSWWRHVQSVCIPFSSPGNLTAFPPIIFPSTVSDDSFPSVCFGILSYGVEGDPLSPLTHGGAGCAREVERDLTMLPLLWASLSSDCKAATARYTCAAAYPDCPSPPSTWTVCDTVCFDVTAACSANEQDLIRDMIPSWMTLDCATLPNANCNSGDSPPDPATMAVARCEPYTGETCGAMTTGPVYIPLGHTMAEMEADAASKKFLFSMADRTTGCDVAFSKFVCSQIFMPCQTQSLHGRPVALPRLPAQELCLDYASKCSLMYDNGDRNTPNFHVGGVDHPLYPNCSARLFAPGRGRRCDGTWAVTPGFDFPSALFSFPNTVNVNSTVNSFDGAAVTSASLNIQCPKPLVIPENPDAYTVKLGVLCSRPCPSYAFLDEEYKKADAIMWVVSTISFILAIFLFATYSVFRQKRRQRIVFIFVTIVFIISTLVWITTVAEGSRGHVANIGCANNSELVQTDQFTWCTFSGALEVFFTLFASCWWLVSAFDLFLRVVLDKRYAPASKQQGRLWIMYNVFAWGVAGNAIVVGIALKTLGGSDGLAWCALSNQNWSTVQYWVEYIPLTIISLTGLVFMVAIMRVLCTTSKKAGTHRAPGWWRKYIRPVVFIIAFFFVWLSFFVVRFGSFASEKEWADSSEDFIQCLMVDQHMGWRTCPPKPAKVPSVGLWLMIHLSVSAPAIWLFLIYGHQRENYDLWSELFVEKFGWKWCKRKGVSRRPSVHDSSDKTPTHGSRGGSKEHKGTAEQHPLHLQKGINDIDLAAELAPEKGNEAVDVPNFDFGDEASKSNSASPNRTGGAGGGGARLSNTVLSSNAVSASASSSADTRSSVTVAVDPASGAAAGATTPAHAHTQADDRQRSPSNNKTVVPSGSSPKGKEPHPADASGEVVRNLKSVSTASILRAGKQHEYTSSAELLKFIEEEESKKPDYLPVSAAVMGASSQGSPRRVTQGSGAGGGGGLSAVQATEETQHLTAPPLGSPGHAVHSSASDLHASGGATDTDAIDRRQHSPSGEHRRLSTDEHDPIN